MFNFMEPYIYPGVRYETGRMVGKRNAQIAFSIETLNSLHNYIFRMVLFREYLLLYSNILG